MPILFSFLSNHRDFPSDSDSDDPDFEGGDSMDTEDSGTSEKGPPAPRNNGNPSTACSPVLARSPDTTTATLSSGKPETSFRADDSNHHKKKRKKDAAKKVKNASSELATKKRKYTRKNDNVKVKRRRERSIMIAENVEGDSLKLVLKKKFVPEMTKYVGPPPCAPGLWDRAIPKEILLKIFQHAVDQVGALPFLVSMQEVCSEWRAVAQDVSLWRKLDLSTVKVTEFQLLRWVKSGMLARVLELNLSRFGTELQHSTIVSIIQCCPRLEMIGLAHNPKITLDTIKYIIDNCVNLRGIDLSGITKNRGNSHFVPVILKPLLEKHGSKLTQLLLSENAVGSFTTIVNMVPVRSLSCSASKVNAQNRFRVFGATKATLSLFRKELMPRLLHPQTMLPKLQVLDLSNIKMTSNYILFPLERIQESCPDMRVLRLANVQIRFTAGHPSEIARSPGFPKLEELSVAAVDEISDVSLDRILKKSEKLTLLDIRNCRGPSVSGLVKIPAWDLTEIFLSNCAAVTNPDVELVFKKWAHSLKVIDVSWVSHDAAINSALQTVATHADTPPVVYDLDLRGSSVSFETLKLVLEKCLRLKKIDLTSCRGLPRGIKRVYEGTALEGLRSQVLAGRFEEGD